METDRQVAPKTAQPAAKIYFSPVIVIPIFLSLVTLIYLLVRGPIP